MVPQRFEALVRSLSRPRSRRSVISLLASTGAVLGGATATVVDAKKKHHKKKTKCTAGTKHCGSKKKCFDLQTDPEHCGTCSVACDTGEACDSGQCVTVQGTCQAGDDACLGVGDPFCFAANGDECICQTRLQGGTRCAYFGNASTCDQCETDDDCFALGFPPGSGCMQDFGGSCQACQDNNKGICAIPCGSPDPTT